MTFRTRFAPSPTGFLHPGNARTAVFAYLAAKAKGGEMLLRIEDSDRARNTPGGAEDIAADLAALGLQWRQVPPQSARVAGYEKMLGRLQSTGAAYPCFCPPDELAKQRQASIAAGKPPKYSGKCAELPDAEAKAKMAKGEAAAWRFRMPAGIVSVRDIVRGALRFDGGGIGDFVIRRANGDFSFIFINALDDAADGITCVLRGEDHLPNVPRQLAILAALDLPPPQYGHLPLMTDAAGKPLSKRGGAPSLRELLRTDGYLPMALMNYLARIGHKFADDGMMTMAQLADGFDLSRLSKSAAKFDMRQLQSCQKAALRAMTAADKLRWMAHLIPPGVDGASFVAAIADNIAGFADVRQWADALTTAPVDDDAAAVIQKTGGAFYRAAAAALADGESWRQLCAAVAAATMASGKGLYLPLRAALTGKTSGPEMAAFFDLLPFGEKQRRIARYCQHSAV